jgi:hypothetical protein
MNFRGWIYVLVNPSLEGLVKIGFSTKDPAIRVKELSSTGVPRTFLIAYEAIVENPRDLEQRVHSSLKLHHENKEFFRITPEEAVAVIRDVANKIGAALQLEKSDLPGLANESSVLPATTVVPDTLAISIVPRKVQTRNPLDSHQFRKARVAHIISKQPRRACPHCGSEKRPSPSGYCQSCFGVHRCDA